MRPLAAPLLRGGQYCRRSAGRLLLLVATAPPQSRQQLPPPPPCLLPPPPMKVTTPLRLASARPRRLRRPRAPSPSAHASAAAMGLARLSTWKGACPCTFATVVGMLSVIQKCVNPSFAPPGHRGHTRAVSARRQPGAAAERSGDTERGKRRHVRKQLQHSRRETTPQNTHRPSPARSASSCPPGTPRG